MLCVIKFTCFWWSYWQWPADSPLCWCPSGCRQSGMMDLFCEVVRNWMQDMTEREKKEWFNYLIPVISRVELATPLQEAEFKGDLLYKNYFYKVFEHSCVAAVCENNQPIMLKSTNSFFFIKPINHEQSLQKSGFRFSLCSRQWGEKVPPICDALCPISINTAQSEKLQTAITGNIYNVST